MAVMKMIALTMVGPHEEMEPVARQMVLSGGFQPIPLDFLVNDRRLRSRVTTESENPYDDLLSKMATIWKGAGERIPEPEPIQLGQGFNYKDTKVIVEQVTEKLETWSQRRDVLADDLERLEATKNFVEALKNLDMKPNELSEAQFALPSFGRLSIDNFNRLVESTIDAPLLAVELSRTQENVWALVFFVPGYKDGAKKILDAVYFREFSIEEISNQLSQADPLKQLEGEIRRHEREINELESSSKSVLDERRKEFETLFSRLYTMQRVYDICKGRGEVSGMYVLSGWIPEDTFGLVKETLDAEAPMTSVLVEAVQNMDYAGIRIPTMLRNNKLVRSFQYVVEMYSIPSYGEVDPSPFVALTFILFFGFMFGDVGHGFLLWLAALYMGKKGILNKSLAYVMKCASCSSMVFGVLYGSVFGIEKQEWALWISPMHDITTLFGVAIFVGVLLISTGMILNMIVCYRRRDFGRLLFDGQGLAGLFVYWGAAIAIVISILGFKTPFPVAYLWYVVGFVFLLTFFRDTLARTLLHQNVENHEPRSVQVIEVLHNLMNYFANTASFIRLGAFALNHFALSLTVLVLSNLFGKLPGGIVLKVIMFIVGNLFIVGLEGLIVFIQVLRLEYYEFFSKFYRGGGSLFKPVGWGREKSHMKS
ncbi:MAG: ATPase [Synergistaceae bacterium]|jgi:V/A-type H+-transporting ATPase subunit I|nr:ATPase [Synergistaceae bacterium]